MGNFNADRGMSGRSFGRRDFGDRNTGRGFDRGGDRQMHKATCSNCGKECEVPFRPTSGKPVYCSDCFGKIKGSRQDSPRPQRPDFRAPSFDQNKNQLDSINVKLDKILRILEPKIAVANVPAEASKDIKIEPVSLPKAKKVAKKSTSTKKK